MRRLLSILALALAACNGSPVAEEYVVRLGSETLSRQELEDALAGVPVEFDSADASRQIVEQWVTSQLLFAEARRRGIDREPDVRASILEAERAVVVNALLEDLYAEADEGPTDEEIQEYYERNQERLRLVEPYVRLRYISTDSLEAASEARRQLVRLDTTASDAWEALVSEFADEPAVSIALAGSLVPESRAFSEFPVLGQALASTAEGRTSPVVTERGTYHVVQVIERVPAGTIPRRAWIEAPLRQQLQIESRKLLYARLVQRLRNEALAREQLDMK